MSECLQRCGNKNGSGEKAGAVGHEMSKWAALAQQHAVVGELAAGDLLELLQ